VRARRLLLALLIIGGAGATCVGLLLSPLIAPSVLDRLSSLFPGSACPGLDKYLIPDEAFEGTWENLPHPRPETYLEAPFAALKAPDEAAAGRLYVSGPDDSDGWAVLRVYCLRNDLRARSFYSRPGIAGYVDALAIPVNESDEELSLGWAPEADSAEQKLARCRRITSTVSPLVPYGDDTIQDEAACGIWARYGRLVVAFEMHLPSDEMHQDVIQAVISQLESLMTG